MKARDMTMKTQGIEIKNKGVLIFGILLLLIGLGASFYVEIQYEDYWEYPPQPGPYIEVGRSYPYQGIGVVLVLIGVVFVALGFFYSPRTSETREKERVSVPAPPE